MGWLILNNPIFATGTHKVQKYITQLVTKPKVVQKNITSLVNVGKAISKNIFAVVASAKAMSRNILGFISQVLPVSKKIQDVLGTTVRFALYKKNQLTQFFSGRNR